MRRKKRPVVNPSKAKGTLGETAVVKWLHQWWPNAERRALHGNTDLGDVVGIVGVVIEVKNAKTVKTSEWLRQLAVEKQNASADHGVLVVKPVGVSVDKVGDWWAITTVDDHFRLIRDAGH